MPDPPPETRGDRPCSPQWWIRHSSHRRSCLRRLVLPRPDLASRSVASAVGCLCSGLRAYSGLVMEVAGRQGEERDGLRRRWSLLRLTAEGDTDLLLVLPSCVSGLDHKGWYGWRTVVVLVLWPGLILPPSASVLKVSKGVCGGPPFGPGGDAFRGLVGGAKVSRSCACRTRRLACGGEIRDAMLRAKAYC